MALSAAAKIGELLWDFCGETNLKNTAPSSWFFGCMGAEVEIFSGCQSSYGTAQILPWKGADVVCQ